MKVLYQSRVDLYNPRGGDTAQMEHTKSAIEVLDSSIKIDIKAEIEPKDINDYDIVHLFNLDWIPETYSQAKWAHQHGKKIVLSAIHHSEQEVIKYEKNAAYDMRRIYNFIFRSQQSKDVGKNIYRSITYPKKLMPTLGQIFHGFRNQQREVLKMSDIVLVQTEKEAEDIKTDFNFEDFKFKKIVNGVDLKVFENASPDRFNQLIRTKFNFGISGKKIILSVGRIEPRKNQLSLIQAFNEIQASGQLQDYYLIFIGAMTKNSFEYVNKFKDAISENKKVLYVDVQPQEVVASAMSHEGVYVHTSWFETTGLVTLEAAFSNMGVVATGERTKEYLNDSAYYCEPDNLESIKNAILNAVFKPKKLDNMRSEISDQYSWENTAKQTIEVYKNLQSQFSS
jgi:glycosyltransferase involved in cell wall biosynthesis